MKKITFNVPRANGEATEETGYRVKLNVGAEQRLFVLQVERGKPCILTEFRSGLRLTNLNALAVGLMCSRGPHAWGGTLLEWRALGQDYLDQLVSSHGADLVLAKMRETPKVN